MSLLPSFINEIPTYIEYSIIGTYIGCDHDTINQV